MAQQTPSKPAGPPSMAHKPVRQRRKDRLQAGNLLWYVLYAGLLHLLFFGLAAFSENIDNVVKVREIPVELMGVQNPDPKKVFGNQVQGGEEPPPDPVRPPPNPANQAKVAPAPAPEVTESFDIANAIEAVETNSSDTVYRENVVPKAQKKPETKTPENTKPVQRQKVSIAAAAAHAAGRRGSVNLGRGRGGSGKGGVGEAYGIKDDGLPVISGGAVFGTGRKGALKGILCFLPVGTKRLSEVGRCKPEGVMYTNQLNIPPRRFLAGFPGVSSRFEWFALDYNGRFTVSKPGEYKFRLHSDDGSILWINGEKVINNDGTHSPLSKMGSVHLDEGKHRIRVFYFQGPRVQVALQLFVQPPGEEERLWTPKL